MAESENQQQYYFHTQFLNNGLTSNIRPITIAGQEMICMSNDCSIDLYEYSVKGISFKRRYEFHSYIWRMEVLPNKHHFTDYLFIIDRKGRYAFWQPQTGVELVQNGINDSKQQQSNLYKTNQQEGEDSIFCGEMHHFQVLDTKGSIFFNIHHDIIVIDYSIKAIGLKVDKRRRIKIQCIKFRYLNWVQNNEKKLMGVIQENQEKTNLKIHKIQGTSKINSQNQIYKYQKSNLIQFKSLQNNSIIILSLNQLTIIQLTNFQIVANYPIKDTFGKLLSINLDFYGYIGEELLLMNKDQVKSYGSLNLQGQNLLEGKGVQETQFIRNLKDGGKLISISTLSHEILLIILYQNTWKLCHKITCLNPIFSLHKTNNTNSIMAVTSSGLNKYEVTLIQKELCVAVSKEQTYCYTVQRIISVDNGSAIIVSSKEEVQVFRYNDVTRQFYLTAIQIPKQQLIMVNDAYYVTTKGIYSLKLSEETLELLHQDDVVLVQLKDYYLVYLNAQYQTFQYNRQSNQFILLREAASTEYLWSLTPHLDLLVARSDDLSYLLKFKSSELTDKINLGQNVVISAIASVVFDQQQIFTAVGFINGLVLIFNQNNQSIQMFDNYGTQSIQFFKFFGDKIGVISGNKQYLLQREGGIKMKQLNLSYNFKNINTVAYLQKQKQLIFVQNGNQEDCKIIKTVALQSLGYTQNSKELNENTLYRTKSICKFIDQIPIVFLNKDILYVGVKRQIRIYNTKSGQLLKTIDNYFADVIGIQPLNCAILVYGVDQLGRNILTIISPITFQVLKNINLILKDSKYVKSIKPVQSSKGNRFVCRGQKYTTMYELTDTYEANQLFQIKTQLQGYYLDLNQKHQILALTDSYRFIAFYHYADSIIPISRHIAHSEINDLTLLNRSALLADRAGMLTILEFNVQNEHQALRMMMTEVACLNTGSEISVVSKISEEIAFYGTVSGKVGRITFIKQNTYKRLKVVQNLALEQLSKSCNFDYSKWRNRKLDGDKMIDGNLIKAYLNQVKARECTSEKEEEEYKQVLRLYKELTYE